MIFIYILLMIFIDHQGLNGLTFNQYTLQRRILDNFDPFILHEINVKFNFLSLIAVSHKISTQIAVG